jgi:hypothetical protein
MSITPPEPPSWYPVRFFDDPSDSVDLDDGFDSPEEAARGDIPQRFVTILGVRAEGDYAQVWMLTNDRPTFEGYEESVIRIGSQWFSTGGSGGLALDAPAEIHERAAKLGYPGG